MPQLVSSGVRCRSGGSGTTTTRFLSTILSNKGVLMARVKYLHPIDAKRIGLDNFPSYIVHGLIMDMKKEFAEDALLVWSGPRIYNVASKPEIYHDYAK